MTDGVNVPLTDGSVTLPTGSVPSAEYATTVLATAHGDPTPAPLQAPSKTVRPDNVPEQFWDPVKGETRWDDFTKSYAELRSKMDGKSEADPAKPEGEPEADPAKTKIERPDGEANPLTTAVEAMATTYSESGEVTDEQIAAVEALGLPRATIDTYLAGVKALQQLQVQEVHEAAGGAEAFTTAQTWAASALNDADLAYYNENIDNPATRKQTVEWLMAKHGAARPSEGKLVNGAVPPAGQGDVFTSQKQATDAIADPRYAADPAYRKSVGEKMLRSKRAGTMSLGAEMHQRAR